MSATELRPIAFFDMQAQQALIRERIDAGIAGVLASGRFIQGPEVDEVERQLAAFAGVAHAVGVSSGTDALQIAMMAEGIGPGDAVFLPAFTYTATAEVPLLLGATPIFVDVDPLGWNIDLTDLERRLAMVKEIGTLRPRAIVGVDLFGRPAPWPSIMRICEREGMFALDDAAQAFGGALRSRKLGGWAHAAALSFYPTKTLGCYGDGGALLTNDAARAELYRSLRTHGEGKTRYEVLRTGMNGRLDSIQAAILLAKLTLFPQELKDRARAAAWYGAALEGLGLTLPQVQSDADHAWGIYSVLLPQGSNRAAVQAALQAQGVPSAVYYPKPLHQQPAYAKAHAAGLPQAPHLPVSEDLCARILALPMHPYLMEADVGRVAKALRAAL